MPAHELTTVSIMSTDANHAAEVLHRVRRKSPPAATRPAIALANDAPPMMSSATRVRPTAEGSALKLNTHDQELLHQLTAWALEVHADLARHVRADAIDALEVFLGCVAQLLDACEIARKQVGRRPTNLRDAKRVYETSELRTVARGDALDEVLRGLVGETLELDQLLPGQSV